MIFKNDKKHHIASWGKTVDEITFDLAFQSAGLELSEKYGEDDDLEDEEEEEMESNDKKK